LPYQAYSAKGRNPAVDPKTMFKTACQNPKRAAGKLFFSGQKNCLKSLKTEALLKYAKNPKGVPKQKESFRIFLQRARVSLNHLI
jgi:hypothetical protein